MRYPAIKPKRYSGNEEIVSESGEKIATIGDFWSWAYSDVLGNTERGVLAEFLVANALGIQKKDRIAWDKYDLLLEYCGRNISVEVKSSGYFQTWEQKEKSRLIFGIQQTKAWDYITNEYEEKKKRQADIYVFCVHKSEEKNDNLNPLDLKQWDFYILPAKILDEKLGNRKTVSLNTLLKIGAEKCAFEKIRDRIINLVTGGTKMKTITLGSTGIVTPQNAFGALPVQRDDMETAVKILRRAYEGGMNFFDTARAYTDSEEKIGNALSDVRENIFIATKTAAKTPENFRKDLETSLRLMKTDYVDIYQFHQASQCYRPGDGTGMYEAMLEAKAQGKIRHIGITAHKIKIAEEAVESGLYETLQFPLSYLSGERELALVEKCREKNMGFIAMKALAGGLINNSAAAFAWMTQFENVLPIWGIQRMNELEEFLGYFENPAEMKGELLETIEKDRAELAGDFCRGCGYCMPCPAGIKINDCARMSLMIRRAPSKGWVSDEWQAEMEKIEDCIHCGSCHTKCPYGLDAAQLLIKNLEDYRKIIAGEVTV